MAKTKKRITPKHLLIQREEKEKEVMDDVIGKALVSNVRTQKRKKVTRA